MELQQKAANQLKAIRVFNNLTIEQFAEKAGIKRQQLNRWETGGANMSIKSFDRICNSLGLDPEKVICGTAKIKLT